MAMAPEQVGIGIRRYFTKPGSDPYDTVEWERRDARIQNFKDGTDAFFQPEVEFPRTWSVNAANIVAQKYFRGTLGTTEREWSLRQVIDRVADTMTDWGIRDGYFMDDEEAAAFRSELKYVLVHQRAAFNSPVWFNIGVPGAPAQGSACFILAVEDTMDGILNWYREEGTIFKGGSGSGINLSNIRSSFEGLKGGGTASGPVSFMRGADASAGTIKCLHADTPIVTDRGVVPIREVRAGDHVLTRLGYEPVSAVHDNGVRALVRVRTALGDEILCTPEHRFRVRGHDGEEWREAGQIRGDDHVILDVSGSQAGRHRLLRRVGAGHHRELEHDLPTVLDESFALWLGWVYGDGSITTRASAKFVAVQIGDRDPELIGRYRALTRTVFGDSLHLYEDRHAARSNASTSVRFASTQVIRFLEANRLRKAGAAELRVPDAISSSPAGVRAAFLSGLFEADGHVGNGYPQLSTVSRALARGVHRLLLSLGIPSKLHRIDDRRAALGSHPVHVVRVVGGEGVARFAKLVGFVSERKSAALGEAVARKERSPYETQWSLPHVAAELSEVWARSQDSALRRALSPYCRGRKPRRVSLPRARALLERFPDELGATALAAFAYGDELYTTVTVEAAGEGPTLDLTVAGVHQYLVQSVVTHNSGGKTRRAAKMVILNADHPDIEEFIWCKALEERKARALAEAGFDMDLDGKDSHSIQYQNANNSVRVTDDFMRAVLEDKDWDLEAVTTGDPIKSVRARELMRQISEATWECADPGMQFDTTINKWHTAPNTGRINASNPCSEYMHLDNSACNLASINLLKYLGDDGTFDVAAYKHTIEVMFTAQEILVGNADYPTESIGDTSRRFRQLGLGYANLGALLMAEGLPYDSPAGRAWAASLTALMTGHAYATSARTAGRMGPFAGYADNEEPMLEVLRMHRAEAAKIDEELVPPELLSAAQRSWDDAVELGERYGVRNSQATVLAPTGCLVGGTLVPTGRGLVRLRSLGDPDGPQWQDLGLAVLTDDGAQEATQFYVNGLEQVVDVVTERGYRLRGTAKHRIKVVDETGAWVWRRLADVQTGDRVPLALDQLVGEPQEVVLPPLGDAYWTGEHSMRVPRTMTPELAEFVGYFMGDGSLHAKGIRLCVAAEDFEVGEHLVRLGKELFGLEAHRAARQGYTELSFHSVRFAQWWEASGFAKQMPAEGHTGKGYRPHVPEAVLHANRRETYRAFLRGLFEADGTVTGGIPTWTTASLSFADDVQSLLLALGFPTTRKRDVSGRGSQLSVLRLLNTSYHDRWLTDVGFLSARKTAKVGRSEGRQAARKDYIPVTRVMADRLAPVNDSLRKTLLMEVSRGRVSRRAGTELLARTGDAELAHLLGFFYDAVASAELGDEELTYDLSVPANVTYVANGFVSHNTIGLMMDCDTTGIEPDLALTKAKKLVGGGTMYIVNQTVPRALAKLGYSADQVDAIVGYVDEHKTIIGAPGFNPEHLSVFACSMGDNTIHYMGHVTMMGAVQPFISGAISKCVIGDTLLTTADGLVRIGSLHRGEDPDSFRDEVIEVASLDGPQKTDAFYYGGLRAVREVVLRSGHRVVATPNHRLLVAGEHGLDWKATSEIEPGDHVAVQYGDNLWASVPARFDDFTAPASDGTEDGVRPPAEMTEELAFLLGAYASQGHTTRSTATVAVSSSVDSVLERVAGAWRSQLGVDARIERRDGECPRVVVSSKSVVAFLDYLGCGSRASEQRIPNAVLRSPRPMVLAYLQGLALDAHVTGVSAPKWTICLDSPRLLDDLQAVLTNLGIVHSRASRLSKKTGKTYGEVHATGFAAQQLVRDVPFLEPEQAARAGELLARELDAAAEENLQFSPVASVDDAGLREVFDVSVPSTHAFVGNGIVNHNTVNMPEEATVEDVEHLHVEAWRLGLKAVAIYRDNCKVGQPLSTQKKEGAQAEHGGEIVESGPDRVVERIVEHVIVQEPVRQKLPRVRRSKTFSFRVADCHGYATVGEFEDGRPGEVFLKVAKQGSTLAGIMDAFAISISLGLQYGVPLRAFVEKFTNMRFEPAGMTDDPDLRFATSLADYIFRRLAVEYLSEEERRDLGILTVGERLQPTLPGVEEHAAASVTEPGLELLPPEDRAPSAPPAPPAIAPPEPRERDTVLCYVCGDIMQRAGSCYACPSCGTTSGCS